MITTAARRLLEAAINRALRADPDSGARLEPLQGQLLRLTLSDWQLSVDIIAEQHGLILHRVDNSQTPDCSIATDLPSLLQAVRQQKQAGKHGSAGLTPGIEIHGQSHLAQAFMQLIFKLDIDWEYHLSQRIGEHATARIAQTARAAKNTLQNIHKELRLQTRDYLQLESQLLPTAEHVNQFCQQVTQLQHAVERLQARLDHMS